MTLAVDALVRLPKQEAMIESFQKKLPASVEINELVVNGILPSLLPFAGSTMKLSKACLLLRASINKTVEVLSNGQEKDERIIRIESYLFLNLPIMLNRLIDASFMHRAVDYVLPVEDDRKEAVSQAAKVIQTRSDR